MVRLTRDRVTWLLYAQLGVFGYFLYGLGPAIPLLRDEQGTTRAVASLHSVALAVGAVIAATVFPTLVRRRGRPFALWLGTIGLAVGTVVLCLVRPVPATLAAVLLASVFGTILVSGVPPALADRHGSAVAPAAISESNASAAGMGLLAPLVIGASVAAGLGWRPGLALTVPLIVAVALIARVGKVRLPGGTPPLVDPDRPTGRLPGVFWLAWGVVVACASVEICIAQWASDELRGHAGMARGPAAASVSAVIVGMFLGRLAGGRIALRFGATTLLLGAIAVCAAGFVVFWMASVAWLAVAGLFLCGLGISLHFPLGIALALGASNGRPDVASARTLYASAIAFGAAPFALAAIADRTGVHRAFLLVPILLAIGAAGVALVRKAERRALPASSGLVTQRL